MANPRQDDRTIHAAQTAQTAQATQATQATQAADAVRAGQDAARRVGDEFRRTAEDTTRNSVGAAAELGRSALDAGERAARSGAEIMQHNTELMRTAWRSCLDLAAQMTGRSGDELARVFPLGNPMSGEDARRTVEQSSRNMEAMVESGTVLAKGVEDITREWFDFARGRVEHNLASVSEFTKCRSPQHVAALQGEMMRDNMEGLLQVARKVAEISVRVAEDAMGKVAAGKGQRAA